MKGRHTLILLAVFVVLAGYVYFFEMNRPEDEGSDTETPKVFTYKAEDVVGLEVSNAQGETASVQKGEGEVWKVTAPVQDVADSTRVSSLVGQMAALSASRVLTGTTSLADYGLASPALTTTLVISDGSRVSLLTGSLTPNQAGYYALRSGSPDVYIIFSYAVQDLERMISEPPVQPTPTPQTTVEPTAGFVVAPTSTPVVTPTVASVLTPTLPLTATTATPESTGTQ